MRRYRIIRAVRPLRRIAAFVLLVALPFQAAIGATGWHCLTSTHHVHVVGGAVTIHDHSVDRSSKDALEETVVQQPVGRGALHLAGDGECGACSSCCFSAAVIPTTLSASIDSPPPAKISINVDTAMTSRFLDDLFRPPRTTTL